MSALDISDPEAPVVSVIVIFHDEERFLAEAVQSVLDQTYPDWELLLVDDGSRDASTDQARALAASHPSVRYLEHPGHANLGMSATRNLGLREARGRCIAFLDADDVWLPDKLQEQVALMDRHGVGLVYGRVQEWHSWAAGAATKADTLFDLGLEPDVRVAGLDAFTRLVQNRAQTPTTSGSLIGLREARAVGGFEDGFVGMYEDQAFFGKLMLASDVWVSGALWARYRQHPDSATAQDAVPYREGRVAFLRWLRAEVARSGAAPQALPVIDAELQRLTGRAPLGQRLRLAARALLARSGRRG